MEKFLIKKRKKNSDETEFEDPTLPSISDENSNTNSKAASIDDRNKKKR